MDAYTVLRISPTLMIGAAASTVLCMINRERRDHQPCRDAQHAITMRSACPRLPHSYMDHNRDVLGVRTLYRAWHWGHRTGSSVHPAVYVTTTVGYNNDARLLVGTHEERTVLFLVNPPLNAQLVHPLRGASTSTWRCPDAYTVFTGVWLTVGAKADPASPFLCHFL
jgi:hypothetical protein